MKYVDGSSIGGNVHILLWMPILLVTGAIGIFWHFYHSVSIKETPTCVRYGIGATRKNVSTIVDEINKMLASRGLQESASQGDAHIWNGKTTQISIYLNQSSVDLTIFVCANENYSQKWQEFAMDIEKIIVISAIFRETNIQLNSSVYRCDPNCYIFTDAPVNFEELNRTVLAFPVRR